MGWAGEKASKINEIVMLERDRKSFKIWWFSLPKSRKREKNTLRETLFFSLVFFLSILEGFGEGVGRILRSVWRLSAPLGQLLDVFF